MNETFENAVNLINTIETVDKKIEELKDSKEQMIQTLNSLMNTNNTNLLRERENLQKKRNSEVFELQSPANRNCQKNLKAEIGELKKTNIGKKTLQVENEKNYRKYGDQSVRDNSRPSTSNFQFSKLNNPVHQSNGSNLKKFNSVELLYEEVGDTVEFNTSKNQFQQNQEVSFEQLKMDCLDIIKRAYLEKGHPESSIPIMLSTISDSEIRKYGRVIKQWYDFCRARDFNQITQVSVNNVLEFSDFILFDFDDNNDGENVQSALSLILRKQLMNDDDVKRYFNGLSSFQKTNKKKCANEMHISSINIEEVERFISTMGDNSSLTLPNLSKKLVTLMRLITKLSFRTLANLRWKNIKVYDETRKIVIAKSPKVYVKNESNFFKIPFNNNDSNLCLKEALDAYFTVTKDMREKTDFLFITLVKPYRQCSAQILKHWYKDLINKSKSLNNNDNLNHASTSALTAAELFREYNH